MNLDLADAVLAWLAAQPGFAATVTPSRTKWLRRYTITIRSMSPVETCVLGPFWTGKAAEEALDDWLTGRGFGVQQLIGGSSLSPISRARMRAWGRRVATHQQQVILDAIESGGKEPTT